MTNATAANIRIAEEAAGSRAFVANGDLLFDTVDQRNAAATALESQSVAVERIVVKFPGRPIRKPAIRFA